MSNFTANEGQRQRTPLPRLQLFIVYLIQFAEPITGLVIYPFINQLVRDTNIARGDETKTGYYAGIIETAFYLTQCLTVVQWGYLSDKIGRRPVLILGPLGASVSMLLFGLSKSFWSLLLFRCLQGCFNGNIGVSKTVVAEITDETNIGDAYAISPVMWSSAMTLAPIIGGILSQPAERWPDSIGGISFFKSYPYFLPCATTSFIAFLSFAAAFVGLEETLPSAKRKQLRGSGDDEASLCNCSDNTNYGAVTSTVTTERENQKTVFQTSFHSPLPLVFLNYGFLAFISMANAVLVPLMYSTPLEYGGLGMSPYNIGSALGLFGMINALFMLKFLGPLMRIFGTRKLYQILILSSCIIFAIYPFLKYAAQRAGGVDGFVMVFVEFHLGLRTAFFMAFACMQVLFVQSVPEGVSLATASGFAQLVISGMNAIAPFLASSLFSVSLQKNLADGNMIYYVFIAMSLLGVRASWLLRDPIREDKAEK